MVILLSGASHTGKTLLAQKLLEAYRYPYLSIDHLKMGLIRSGQTRLTPMDDDKLTDYLWPILREMIVISFLSIPMSGRKIGVSLQAFVTPNASIVWLAT